MSLPRYYCPHKNLIPDLESNSNLSILPRTKMLFKFAIVLTSMLAETAVFVGSTSTRLGRTAQSISTGGYGETETIQLRKMKKVQVEEAIALHDSESSDKNEPPSFRGLRKANDSEDWNHGTVEVAAKRRDSIEICAPSAAKDGDTLFLFLR